MNSIVISKALIKGYYDNIISETLNAIGNKSSKKKKKMRNVLKILL